MESLKNGDRLEAGIKISFDSFKPTRVVINSYGDGVTPERAERDYEIKSDIIFIRKDGWSLGAPEILESTAYSIWQNEWKTFIRKRESIFRDIEEY